jgi:tetratricopeptide (TPR) repeat protein
MFPRPLWILGAVFCLASQSLGGGEVRSALALWRQGQEAMRQGQPARAVDCYQKSLARDARLARNHLSLAAAYLELGEPRHACDHLARYVAAHPRDLEIRSHYAEMLWRLRRLCQARVEFEHCIEAGQERGTATQELIHCHSRVMEIAEEQEDAYGEHLHRGIGLYLLGCASAGVAGAESELPSEGLFCKAAGELTLAQEERPDEARPAWYLYTVWSRLAQRPPALRCLREAGAAAPFSYLTPTEQRALHLVSHAQQTTGSLK